LVASGKKVRGDNVCARIKWLTERRLRKIATDPDSGGWLTLFLDPWDGRFWERSYPKSEMHGGGPPTLTCITEEEAAERYEIGLRKLRRMALSKRGIITRLLAVFR
jgi:hypothetical protein